MISVKFIFDRLSDYGQKHQSGLDVVSAFNSRLAEVQSEVFSDLAPLYQGNEKVRNILQTWVKTKSGSTSTGVYNIAPTTPQVFARVVAAAVTDVDGNILFPMHQALEGELVMYANIPQRKPSYAKKQVYYNITDDNTANFSPVVASDFYFNIYYLIYPTVANIAFTYTETNDEYVMTYNNADSNDLNWTAEATNLILYKMLEKYGITNREQWLSEYSKLGIGNMIGGQAA